MACLDLALVSTTRFNLITIDYEVSRATRRRDARIDRRSTRLTGSLNLKRPSRVLNPAHEITGVRTRRCLLREIEGARLHPPGAELPAPGGGRCRPPCPRRDHSTYVNGSIAVRACCSRLRKRSGEIARASAASGPDRSRI